MLATLEGELGLGLALHALQSQHNLLRGLRLLVENGLGLTTITALLTVVSTLTLAVVRGFSLVSGPSVSKVRMFRSRDTWVGREKSLLSSLHIDTENRSE